MSPDRLDLGPVSRFFQARTGVGLEGEACGRAAPAIEACMAEAGFDDTSGYVDALAQDPALFDALADRITIGESYFFRHPGQFELIAGPILAESEARRSRGGPGLRVWSAGCSDGQEIYSVAILLRERGLLQTASLLATDLSPSALSRARTGRYRDWAVRGPQGHRARAWMQRRDDRWELDRRLCDAVTFERHNLADPTPEDAADLDVVLCRNVLIYLEPRSVRAVAERLCQSLRPGGWLLTGPSDPPLGDVLCLQPEMRAEDVVYRRPHEGVELERRPRVRPTPTPSRRTRSRPPPPNPAHLRRLARLDTAAALRATALARTEHPQHIGLRLLEANLLIALDRAAEAERALMELLRLEPSVVIAHFTLGSLQLSTGSKDAARRSFTRALDLVTERPAAEVVPHADGERSGRLATAARAQLARLTEVTS